MDSLIDEEYVDVIYAADDIWIIDIPKDIFD